MNSITRRSFLKATGLCALASASGCVCDAIPNRRVLVNDVHTQLNPTWMREIDEVSSLDMVRSAIRRAKREHRPVSISGGRHAAGGQQFVTDGELIDTTTLRRVLSFDANEGMIEVESGIQWPELLRFLSQNQQGNARQWTIAQKQTGTDRLSIGGALAANAHGRGLRLPPFISNIESFALVDANGDSRTCSRTENADLFKLVIGGYGLFGFVYSAKLRLVPRRKLRRIVTMLEMDKVPDAFADRINDGFLYGDCQFAIDAKSEDYLWRGILACYEPVPDETPVPGERRKLSGQDWKDLIYLAHVDPSNAFDRYSKHYLSTSGQLYTSDSQYVSDYFDNYHQELDLKLKAKEMATEVIGELYVPRDNLSYFMSEAREDFRRNGVQLIYGTIRLIERDTESFLPWAKQSYACVIFNLHTPHTPEGKARTADAFRRLIDIAIRNDGSYYLTYHKYATRDQLEACYPQFREFLRLKQVHDPNETFQSDWYRHHKKMFA